VPDQVGREPEDAARTQHAAALAERAGGVVEVVDAQVRDHEIERPGAERQRGAAAAHHSGRGVPARDLGAGAPQPLRPRIESGDERRAPDTLRQLDQRKAGAAAQIEHAARTCDRDAIEQQRAGERRPQGQLVVERDVALAGEIERPGSMGGV